MSAYGAMQHKRRGRRMSAPPGSSDVNLFRYGKGVIDLDAKVSDGASLSVHLKDMGDLGLKLGNIKIVASAGTGHHERDIGEESRIFLPQGHQQKDQLLAEFSPYRSGHPKVEEVDAVLPPHEVARVGVCMEKPLY
jgi:hypothetical protein